MKIRLTIYLAVACAYLSAWTAVAIPAHAETWTSTSTYLYNTKSNLPFTTDWPSGCTNQSCIHIRLGSDNDRSGWYLTMDDSGIQIHWTTSKCLDVLNSVTTNGTPITLAECTGANTQHWRPFRNEGGLFWSPDGDRLQNIGTGRCLDAGNPSFPRPPQTGAILQIWDCARTIHEDFAVNQIFSTDPDIWP